MLEDRKAYREDLKEIKSVQAEMGEEILAKMTAWKPRIKPGEKRRPKQKPSEQEWT
jgi:hypothetical protein